MPYTASQEPGAAASEEAEETEGTPGAVPGGAELPEGVEALPEGGIILPVEGDLQEGGGGGHDGEWAVSTIESGGQPDAE